MKKIKERQSSMTGRVYIEKRRASGMIIHASGWTPFVKTRLTAKDAKKKDAKNAKR